MQAFVVVGAGILGSSTAYHLAKWGAKVTLIDRQDPGQATDAGAGIICPWLSQRRNQAWYQLAKNGARFYPALIDELEANGETNTGYAQVGALFLHPDEKKLSQLVKQGNKRRKDAPEMGNVTCLSPAETRSMFPPLAGRYGAVHVSGGARVNGRALRKSLIQAAQKRGVTFLQGDASLVFDDHSVSGVEVEGRKLSCDQVIVTAGAWTNELLKPLNVHFLMTPQRGQIVHLELPNAHTSKWPVIKFPNDEYMLSFENGRIIIGATREDHSGFDYRVTAGGLNQVIGNALEMAPGLVDSTFLEVRVGFRPFTPNFLPVIGPLPSYEGILVANGLGASGLTVGPYLGAELAKLALGRQMEINIRNYDVTNALS